MAFVGSLVPDVPEFAIPGFVRSGNLAQTGLAEGLSQAGLQVIVWSGQPIAAFPKVKRLFCPRRVLDLESGLRIITIPSPNILVLREVCRGGYIFFALLAWAFRNRKKRRCIVTYNLYTPPIPFVFLAARLTRSRIVPALFDLGMPPGDLGRLRMAIYHVVEWTAKTLVPLFDGRIVVTERLARDYGRGKHALLVDGGITEQTVQRLFPLRKPDPDRKQFRMLCAGGLWPGNGVELLLDAMRMLDDPDIELVFAGQGGRSREAVEEMAKLDRRIIYAGHLDHGALFRLYESADLLLNIRLTCRLNTAYLFPSKLLEYLATGKPVLSTAVAHAEREYGAYCFILGEETADALAAMIRRIRRIPAQDRYALGCRARAFMLANKTWKAQGVRIRRYIETEVFSRQREAGDPRGETSGA